MDESPVDPARHATLRLVERVFVGSEALARGALTRHELRTSYRRVLLAQAVARLDALARATHLEVDDVRALALRHPHVKGLKHMDRVLDLVDAGAESPQENRLRLILVDAGLPRPETQIPVAGPDGHPRYFLDMGWPDLMVAVEYDGKHHTDRLVYTRDVILEYLNSIGWIIVRVVAEHRRAEIVHRVRQARELRRH